MGCYKLLAGDDIFALLKCDEDLEYGARYPSFLIEGYHEHKRCKTMPWVTIQWFEGRDYKTKKKVAELVTKAICQGSGCSPEAISLVFKDVSQKDWAHGGKMYSEE